MIGFGQNVNIPDANFKAYLVGNTAINTNGDTEIQVSEASAFNGSIICGNMNISDLTGIEDFVSLTELRCQNNSLTHLNLSNNILLEYLRCSYNQLASLDVSNNTALIQLECQNNQLTSLDVDQNTALTTLNCYSNQLTSIDVSNNTVLMFLLCGGNNLINLDISNNTSLTQLDCSFTQLTSLDLRNGNNPNFSILFCEVNPNLNCISVDDAVWSTLAWTAGSVNISLDSQHYFSNDCSGTGIQENSTSKELLKVTDLLGRETKQTNQPLFYIYDDGTVEKRIIFE